jgi:hypothetical protein
MEIFPGMSIVTDLRLVPDGQSQPGNRVLMSLADALFRDGI